MDDEQKSVGCVLWTLGIGMLLAIASLFMGCTTTKYVPVKEAHTEYRTRTDTIHQKDSIFFRDSIWTNQYMKGDTLVLEKNRTTNYYNNHYYKQAGRDTVIIRDSIPQPYPVEKAPSAKDKFFTKLGNLLLWVIGVVLVLAIAYGVYRLYRHEKKRTA